jgi:type I restriction enzyme S subunit
MNAERLLADYERIADAPGAIVRLRRFVLDLAVHGKLVSQDPKDEPASELLKRMAKEQARLVKAGDLRKPRDRGPSRTLRNPFAIPATWRWVRLDAVGAIVGGRTPSAADPDNFAEPGDGVPWLTPADLGGYPDLYISRGARDLSERGSRTSSATLMPAGTVLFTSRAPIGYVAIASNPISTNQGFKSIVPYVAGCSRFIATAMKAFAPEIDAKAPGTTFKEVSGKIVSAIPFPLPPLAEQHRIVAKVDQLMALCDRLEAARVEREAARDRLAGASLAHLNAPDPDTFHDDARFALNVLPALTTRPDQIKQLRQTILNLAVCGRLVPHDSNDEPASELLSRIVAENKKLLLDKGIRPPKPALPAENFEVESKIPATWLHVYLQDVAYQITDGTHLTPRYTDEGKPFLSAQNVKPFRFMPEKHRLVSEVDFNGYRANRRAEQGDILMTRVGAGIGEATVVDSDFEFAFYVSLCLIKIPKRLFSPDYLVLWLNSSEGRDSSTARTYGKSASQGNLNLGLIRTFKVPLPPLAEQHRIVAKVEALMALCDRLEASLAAGDDARRRLLASVLHHALRPDEAPAPALELAG